MNNYYSADRQFKISEDLSLLNRENNIVNQLSKTPVLSRPILRLGDEGEYVRLLQAQLKQLMFFGGNIDGKFGNDTLLSAKAFQTNNKLAVDGIVGRDTWSALIYLYSPLAICTEDFYTVQKGDTLWSISRKFNMTVDELKRINNLTSDLLSIGQKLIISETTQTPPSGDNLIYTVQKGDTLWSISRRFNTTVDSIKNNNNLTSDALSIGQQLIIPGAESIFTYTVERGDTLWSIANRFNTTVDSIKSLNNLTSNLISIGQLLKIQNR